MNKATIGISALRHRHARAHGAKGVVLERSAVYLLGGVVVRGWRDDSRRLGAGVFYFYQLLPRFLGFLWHAPPRVGDLDIPDWKRAELVTICNNVRYRTLERYLTVFSDGRVFVATGAPSRARRNGLDL